MGHRKAKEDIRGYKDCVQFGDWSTSDSLSLSSTPTVACPPGVPCQRMQSAKSDMQDQPLAKRVVRGALTGSEGTVQVVTATSGGEVTAVRSPPICEGEMCGVSSHSVH